MAQFFVDPALQVFQLNLFVERPLRMKHLRNETLSAKPVVIRCSAPPAKMPVSINERIGIPQMGSGRMELFF